MAKKQTKKQNKQPANNGNYYSKKKKSNIGTKVLATVCTLVVGAGAGAGAYYGIEQALNSKNVATPPAIEQTTDSSIVVDGDFNQYLNGNYSYYSKYLNDLPVSVSLSNNDVLLRKYSISFPKGDLDCRGVLLFDNMLWEREDLGYNADNPQHKVNVTVNGVNMDRDGLVLEYKNLYFLLNRYESGPSNDFCGISVDYDEFLEIDRLPESHFVHVVDSLSIEVAFTIPAEQTPAQPTV